MNKGKLRHKKLYVVSAVLVFLLFFKCVIPVFIYVLIKTNESHLHAQTKSTSITNIKCFTQRFRSMS